jgi:hypothetical protein
MRKNVAHEVSAAHHEIAHDLVDDTRIDERAVARYLDDDLGIPRLRGFHYPIEDILLAAAKYMGSHITREQRDGIVSGIHRCGDDNLVERAGTAKALHHKSKHGLPEYGKEDFSGKALRSESRLDDAHDLR